jgi:selenophosphate synthase
MSEQGAIVGALTDGTGVSSITATKFVKDFVADVLLSGAAALVTVNVMGVADVIAAPDITAFAIAGAVIRALYRAALRWATT